MPSRVTMFVFNDFRNDSRVLKEARTLAGEGYSVEVVALHKPGLPERERIAGFSVRRIPIRPVHLRLLGFLRSGKRAPRETPRTTVFGRALGSIGRLLVALLAVLLVPVSRGLSVLGRWTRSTATFLAAWCPAWLRRSIWRVISRARRARARVRSWPKPSLPRWVAVVPSWIVGRLARLRARAARFLGIVWRKVRLGLHDPLKRVLMPWHRSFCYLDFYRRASSYLAVGRSGVDEPGHVFHAHDLNTLPVACWLGRGRQRFVVYDSHELYLDRNRLPPRSRVGRFVTRCAEHVLISRADAVITVNESIASILAERYRIARPTVVMNVPEARSADLTADDSDLRTLCGAERASHLLLYAGSLTFNRGLSQLVASLRYLPGCHLALMGPGATKTVEGLERTARELGLEGRVSILPPVPSDRVAAVAATADIGVAPIENACLSYYLCSPNKLFEYLHAGLAVASSDFPELRRIIDEHECGRTFDPSDPESIAACLGGMIDDPRGLETMRRNARRAAGRYDWTNETTKLLHAYRSVLGSSAAAHPSGAQVALAAGESR